MPPRDTALLEAASRLNRRGEPVRWTALRRELKWDPKTLARSLRRCMEEGYLLRRVQDYKHVEYEPVSPAVRSAERDRMLRKAREWHCRDGPPRSFIEALDRHYVLRQTGLSFAPRRRRKRGRPRKMIVARGEDAVRLLESVSPKAACAARAAKELVLALAWSASEISNGPEGEVVVTQRDG